MTQLKYPYQHFFTKYNRTADINKACILKSIIRYRLLFFIYIDGAVNNAGIPNVGLFHEIDMELDMEMVQLNIVALIEMRKLFSRVVAIVAYSGFMKTLFLIIFILFTLKKY